MNKKIKRINLSDHTDIADLLGADLPVEGGDAGHFQWRNGPFLNVMEQGGWILGGFEQADIERSIGDLWSRVSDWTVLITQELLCSSRIEDGLLFMQRYLQLEQAYRKVSFKRKRDDQLKVLNEVILSVRSTNIGKSPCEQFLMELGKLDSVQQGTFEWVDSLLVRAMERGNWC